MTSRLEVNVPLTQVNVLSWSEVYFVGIKGVGMASLAVLLQQAGLAVSGADVAESFVTDELLQTNQIVVEDFATARIPTAAQGVIFSGAHQGSQHPLVVAARQRGLPCLPLAEAVGSLSQAKKTIVTCGVGGKSTTSAWLSVILTAAGLDPAFSVGVGTIPNLGTSGRWSSGDWFVVEGDEYVADPTAAKVVPRFLHLSPAALLCTGVAFDHPDVYASWEETKHAFAALWQRVPSTGVLVVPAGDKNVEEILALTPVKGRVVRVGTEGDCDVVYVVTPQATGSRLRLEWRKTSRVIEADIQLPGYHNALNAALVAVLAAEVNVPVEPIQIGLQQFRSTPRRFEFKGVTPTGWRCYDDYAHHPREIQAIAATLHQWFADQAVVVAFQPHTFSRTKSLWQDFVTALAALPGEVCLLPIFASAREQADQTTRSEDLVTALHQAGKKQARFVASHQELLEYIQQAPGPGVFITLGAGDIYTVYEHLTLQPSASLS